MADPDPTPEDPEARLEDLRGRLEEKLAAIEGTFDERAAVLDTHALIQSLVETSEAVAAESPEPVFEEEPSADPADERLAQLDARDTIALGMIEQLMGRVDRLEARIDELAASGEPNDPAKHSSADIDPSLEAIQDDLAAHATRIDRIEEELARAQQPTVTVDGQEISAQEAIERYQQRVEEAESIAREVREAYERLAARLGVIERTMESGRTHGNHNGDGVDMDTTLSQDDIDAPGANGDDEEIPGTPDR